MKISNDINVGKTAMGTWKQKKIKAKKSQTPGKKKGDSCQRIVKSLDKGYFGRTSKSYKDPRYSDYCALIDTYNK